MDLRDELAVQRTVLANQRTLLTFTNTSLALLVAGITLVKFFQGQFVSWLGWSLIAAGAVLFGYGLKNHSQHKRLIECAYKTDK